MKAVEGAHCSADEDDATATLLAEFRTWLDRERSLSPVSVRCYGAQAKTFLVDVGGADAVGGLDAGKVLAFMVDHARDRNTWSAKAMVTSLRAFLRFAHATGRTAVPLAGVVRAEEAAAITELGLATLRRLKTGDPAAPGWRVIARLVRPLDTVNAGLDSPPTPHRRRAMLDVVAWLLTRCAQPDAGIYWDWPAAHWEGHAGPQRGRVPCAYQP